MAGLLAWAADVVGGHGKEGDDDIDSIPIYFTAEQQTYAAELDRKASSLSRSIQDLRLRLPPPDISQRLPHLLAHSLASNAALALQLNAHSATREQAQLREQTLVEENAAYEKAISDCENKIQEKNQEADSLVKKLKELEAIETNHVAKSKDSETAIDVSESHGPGESVAQFNTSIVEGPDTEAIKSGAVEILENKKRELSAMEEKVQELEKTWKMIQDKAFKQQSPAQREKALDKQLHGLIEQLAAKQAQAEGLVGEIRTKEMEFEGLNGLWRRFGSSNTDANATRNRFRRTNSDIGSDYGMDSHSSLPFSSGGRNETQNRLMYIRSAFVIYILALHVLVFIKISF